jgi:hypothetical protein
LILESHTMPPYFSLGSIYALVKYCLQTADDVSTVKGSTKLKLESRR